MSLIWTKAGPYRKAEYSRESDLEDAILEVQGQLFGPSRIYLPIKKLIGAKGGVRNIPDGYLIDLASSKPRLYVVENELSSHDPLRHVAVQILQFSLSFEAEPRAVRKILFVALQSRNEDREKCELYAKERGFRNLDHLLDSIVFEGPFAALVIIDELAQDLETVLVQRFQFGVEVLQLAPYENSSGERVYAFEPFLVDVADDTPAKDTAEIDTVVVPARAEGFEEVFLGEDRWHAVRIHGTVRPQIKYAAAYQVAPVSAITHIAPVKSIEPWKDSGKVVINFSEPAREIGPIGLVKNGKARAPQNLRYTSREQLVGARTLDDVWGVTAK